MNALSALALPYDFTPALLVLPGVSSLCVLTVALAAIALVGLASLAALIHRRFRIHKEALHGSEERYRRIVASSLDAFIGVSAQGNITDWNEQAARTFGWPLNEALGRRFDEMVCVTTSASGAAGANYIHELAELCAWMQGRMDVEAQHRDGRRFTVELTVSPIDAEGFAVFLNDVTERKLVEREMESARASAEESNRAKSEFLANMSHEIRTPLNGVIGMTDLALETELTAEQRDYLETVKLSADSLLGVINDILDFSKIEAGKIDLEEIRVDLRECIEHTLKTLALRADEKGLELLCDVSADLPEAILGDPGRLRQIVTNLVGNAIKFTDKGEVSVALRQQTAEDGSPMLCVMVTDSGIGIAADKLNHIFASFSQADSSTTRQFGGTGLGLTISRKLIELMDGRIWVESKLGEGSRFHFTLPLYEAEPLQNPNPSEPQLEHLSGLHALIVDDNRTNRRILEGLLAHWGMRPASAADGTSALRLMESASECGDPFRLVLTDMHMPGMDGFMVVQEMQKEAAFRTATVMMLSSGGHRGDAAKCQELGVAAYLLKPVRRTELQEAICRALAGTDSNTPAAMITAQTMQAERASDTFLDILLAEDNEVNQKLAVRLLEKRGHRVQVVNSGLLAVQAVGERPFDLVLMDVQMPEMDGLEATQAIRAREIREGGNWHQPIVAMTALAMKGDKERCLQAGMDGYLTKPIRTQELDNLLDIYTSAAAGPPRVGGTAANAADAVDMEELLARVDGELVFVGELVDVLRSDCPLRLGELELMLAAGDRDGVERTAHGLKGALANLSAKRAAATAGALETAAETSSRPALQKLTKQLRTEIDEALTMLDTAVMEATR